MAASRESRQLYWLFQFAGWGLYCVPNAVAATMVLHVPWSRSAGEMALVMVLGVALSHAMRLFMRRHHWHRLPLRARIPRILIISLMAGAVVGLLTTQLRIADLHGQELAIGPERFQPFLPVVLQVLNWVTLFALWNALYFVALSIRARQLAELREAELRAALQASELRLLKSQLNPHFLFNALNTVRALIADEPAQAQKAVTQLARTLRYTLGAGQEDLVTLQQELAIVEDYLGFETLRLGSRLVIQREIATDVLECRIPVMLLQTLVENAIKHGIAELPAGGVLRLYAGTTANVFVLEVENPVPDRLKPAAHEGIGIGNARTRLRLLFGPDATLDLDLRRSGWAMARVRLPLS